MSHSAQNNKQVIPIFFTFDENYVVPAIVTFFSLLHHAEKSYCYELYVLHPGISAKAQRELQRVVGKFPHASLHFYDTSNDAIAQECPSKSHFSKEIYFKLCAPELFPQHKRVLCSDVDVVFLGDVSKAFTAFADEDFYYAGVDTILPTSRAALYRSFSEQEQDLLSKEIAAGFLLFNLETLRRDKMQTTWTEFYQNNYARLPFPEQDCMAICAGHSVRHLSMRYCVCNTYYNVDPQTTTFYEFCQSLPKDDAERRRIFSDALAHPIQLHFIGAAKPWNAFGVSRQRIWFKYLWMSGATGYYILELPRIIRQRLRRYSVSRFFQKLKTRLFKR